MIERGKPALPSPRGYRLSTSCSARSVAAGNLRCCSPRMTPAAASTSRPETATGMFRAVSCRPSVPRVRLGACARIPGTRPRSGIPGASESNAVDNP